MRIQPGWLRHRVTVQEPDLGQAENGEPATGWTDVATLWASVTDVSGREYIAAGGLQNSAKTKILIRYRAGIMPSMRVLHGIDIFTIEAVLGQDKESLILMCTRSE